MVNDSGVCGVAIQGLTTCHNRRDQTLASLSDLFGQSFEKHISLAITVVDDGSTDGTGDAIRDSFPEVEVISGTGSLFWAGGMRLGWVQSVRHKRFDYLLVFNDDIRLHNDALLTLLADLEHVNDQTQDRSNILAGAFADTLVGCATYGGFIRSTWWHPLRFESVGPTGSPRAIDTLNMNAALIPANVVRRIGFLADYFVHAGADQEYGLRVVRNGGRVWLSSTVIGCCDKNSPIGTSEEPGIPAWEKLRRLLSAKGDPPGQRAAYFRAYAGLAWPILWAGPYVRVLWRMVVERFLISYGPGSR